MLLGALAMMGSAAAAPASSAASLSIAPSPNASVVEAVSEPVGGTTNAIAEPVAETAASVAKAPAPRASSEGATEQVATPERRAAAPVTQSAAPAEQPASPAPKSRNDERASAAGSSGTPKAPSGGAVAQALTPAVTTVTTVTSKVSGEPVAPGAGAGSGTATSAPPEARHPSAVGQVLSRVGSATAALAGSTHHPSGPSGTPPNALGAVAATARAIAPASVDRLDTVLPKPGSGVGSTVAGVTSTIGGVGSTADRLGSTVGGIGSSVGGLGSTPADLTPRVPELGSIVNVLTGPTNALTDLASGAGLRSVLNAGDLPDAGDLPVAGDLTATLERAIASGQPVEAVARVTQTSSGDGSSNALGLPPISSPQPPAGGAGRKLAPGLANPVPSTTSAIGQVARAPAGAIDLGSHPSFAVPTREDRPSAGEANGVLPLATGLPETTSNSGAAVDASGEVLASRTDISQLGCGYPGGLSTSAGRACRLGARSLLVSGQGAGTISAGAAAGGAGSEPTLASTRGAAARSSIARAGVPGAGNPSLPSPSPSGPAGVSGAGAGASGFGLLLFSTLAGLLLLAAPRAMRRLRLASEPWRQAPFVLAPERPG